MDIKRHSVSYNRRSLCRAFDFACQFLELQDLPSIDFPEPWERVAHGYYSTLNHTVNLAPEFDLRTFFHEMAHAHQRERGEFMFMNFRCLRIPEYDYKLEVEARVLADCMMQEWIPLPMKDGFYFQLTLTENEHDIVEGMIREWCEKNECEVLYYRKLKKGHVPLYREVKVLGKTDNLQRWMVQEDILFLQGKDMIT